ncbi:Krr1-interacting protein involved in 40s ribosome biogenesis, partial [Globisporangium splendens]
MAERRAPIAIWLILQTGMAGKKKRSKKSGGGVNVAPVAKEEHDAADELFAPKGSKQTVKAEQQEKEQEEEPVELKVNEKFAKTFLEQKRKEELQRLEKKRELYGDDDDESDSESETEDEDGEQLTRALDADIRKTLKLIRKKDPAIYDKSIAFFKKDDDDGDNSDGSDGEDGSKKKNKKKKKKSESAPLYYKDLVRQQVIAGDVDSSDDERDNGRVMTYGEEQAKLKQEFLSTLKQATASDDDENDKDDDEEDLDGGLFTIRKKTDDEKKQEDEEYASFTNKYGTKLKENEMNPEAFLEHYLSSEGWKDKSDVIPHYDEIVNDDEDAEELEKAEEFEHNYNFRFEEEGSGMIQTHARHIEDSMRREDDSRKRKRTERKERKALERLKKEEELRRLKNLKQAEIQSKLEKVAKLMGRDDAKLLASDLEGEFDPEEYDKRMQQVFDEEYYNEDDDGMEKPTWDEEEDKELFAGLPVDPEDEEEQEDDEEEQEQASNIIEADDDEEAEEDDDEAIEGDDAEEDEDAEVTHKNMSKQELKRASQKYLNELYSLDYEDLIGDLKCRFKYRQVKTNDFGLTVDEIMTADDKELKALVSLKKLAPYLEEEYKVDRKRVKQFKKSLEEAKRERMEKRKKKTEDSNEGAEEPIEAAAEAGVAKSAGKKRKRIKKSKASASAETETKNEDEEDAPVSKKPKSENESEDKKATKEKSSNDLKKKQRRSKKKGDSDAANAYKATGLSSSRLESYKLMKPSKK